MQVQQSILNKKLKTKTMTTLHLRKSSGRSPLRRGLFLIALVLACFGLSPTAQTALPPPAPDGGYINDNTAEGSGALSSLTTGTDNTAIGSAALTDTTKGSENTAIGTDALSFNSTGTANTATGVQALQDNTSGGFNTATGLSALFSNTTGANNTATGVEALDSNTTGTNNTATGFEALFSNTTISSIPGKNNTANGAFALFRNTTGSNNTATGDVALNFNTTGVGNTADGLGALRNNSTGANNTATGFEALQNTTGGSNTALGFVAGQNLTGTNNTVLGAGAGFNLTTGNSNIDIGNVGVASDANTIRIGKQGTQTRTFVAGITGATVTGATVMVNTTTGQLGIGGISSRRFKDEIKPMDKASEAILALQPVTFRYKKELDPDGVPQFGLVAEQVEKVNPALVTRDAKGEVYTVRYEAVNAMLLNEFLKEHRTVQELKSTAAKQEATIANQQKQIEALTTGLQKVSAELDVNKAAPQTVANNQ